MSAKKDIDIDLMCHLITEGATWKQISAELGISITQLFERMNTEPEFSMRAREARQRSADSIADKAEEVLQNAPRDPIEMQRARELAQHYRWMAGKRNPKSYGDKIDVTSGGEKLNLPSWVREKGNES